MLIYRVVESVGEGVDDLEAGDHVVAIFNGECEKCKYCKSGKTNLCGEFRVDPFRSVMKDGRSRFSILKLEEEEEEEGKKKKSRQPIYHFLNTSTFAEYTVLDSACVAKIHPEAPLRKMCLLSCGISTGIPN